MRTKNLNLKKKIAFIASVAMIATTAAYLPAEVTQNIFNSSITVEATQKVIDNADIYIKVNGKYLALKQGTTDDFKLYATKKALNENNDKYEAVTLTAGTNLTNAGTITAATANAKYSKIATGGTAALDVFEAKGKTGIALPYDTPANATVSVEFALKSTVKNGYFVDDVKEYELTLDNKGVAEFTKNKKVVILGDDAVLDKDEQITKGEVEYFDLEGLKFTVDKKAAPTGVDSISWTVGGKAETPTAVGTSLKKVTVNGSDVYATVIENKFNTNAASIIKGSVVQADLTMKAGWSKSTTPNFSVNENGIAESQVITYTSNSGEKEYFIYRFALDRNLTATLTAGLQLAVNKKVGTINADTATALDALSAAGYHVESKLVTEKNKTELINVLYIYTNENDINKDVKYTLTPTTADCLFTDCVKDTANNRYVLTGLSTGATAENVVTISKDETEAEIATLYLTSAATTTKVGGTGADKDKFVLATGGNTVTPVKVVIKSEYKVPLEYNDENNDQTYSLYDKNTTEGTGFQGWDLDGADAESAVVGNKMDRPAETPKRPGYSFEGWYYVSQADLITAMGNVTTGTVEIKTDGSGTPGSGTVEGVKAFTETSANQQNTDKLNPDVALVANWKATDYKVVLDANGGKFASAKVTALGADTDKTDADDFTTVASKKVTATSDTTIIADATTNKPFRNGYVFKGWGIAADATKQNKLTQETYQDNRPTVDNGTVTLYAIWEAGENTLTFKEISTTVAKVTDDGYFTASPANVSVSSIKFDTDSVVENLPTPTKDGYTFDGWFAKSTNTDGKTIAIPVNNTTKLKYDLFDNAVDTTTGLVKDEPAEKTNTSLTLYAKFSRNTYKINYDLNGGEWKDETTEKAAATSFTVADAADTALNICGANAPKKGTGLAYEFTGWIVNGVKSKKYKTDADVLKAIQKEAGDVTLTATYEETDKISGYGSIYLDLQDGEYWFVDTKENKYYNRKADDTAYAAAEATPVIYGTSGAEIEEKIDGANIFDSKGGANGITALTIKDYVVVKPGYEFTGWYSDKECTKPYTFKNYPTDEEVIVYAGWAPLNTTRYTLVYNLVDADGSLVNIVETVGNVINTGTDGQKTYMGTTGEMATATDKVITYEGKKYYFDAVKSKGMKTDEEVTAAYKNINVNKAVTSFEYDNTKYAKVYGVFSENPETVEEPTKELGNATGVKGTANGDKVTISFKAAANATQYQVCKIVNGKKYYTNKTDATSIDITPASVDYEVYVIAFDKDGNSTHSETIKLNAVKKYDLGTVMDPVATEKMEEDGTKTVTISWSKAENATWYKVFKIVNGKKYWGKKVTDTSYVLKNIPATDSYIVYVAAGDDKGHVTYGARKKVSKYPSVTNVTLAPDKKTVTFDAAEGAVKYQVAKIEENNKVNYSAKSTTTSITLKNAFKAGQKYYVLAFFEKDGKTYSSYSDTFEVK